MFTDAAVKEIARIALERGTGARGLRSVVEEVLEGVLFDVEVGVQVRDHGQDGQGWGAGQAEYVATEGTAELACAAKTRSQEAVVISGLGGWDTEPR